MSWLVPGGASELTVRLGNVLFAKGSLQITDAKGSVWHSQLLDSDLSTVFDIKAVEELPNGTYFIRVQLDDKFAVKRFIKLAER